MSQPQTEARKKMLLDGRAVMIRPLGEDDYVLRERPQERADLVIPGDQDLWR